MYSSTNTSKKGVGEGYSNQNSSILVGKASLNGIWERVGWARGCCLGGGRKSDKRVSQANTEGGGVFDLSRSAFMRE